MSETRKEMNRDSIIVRTSIIGIIANVFLASFKVAIGLLSHSIAIILDAVNNLSDALSSVITIVGTKLAGRAPDKKHPLGYGRIEYLTAMVISLIVLYAGITSLVESVKKIIEPDTPEYKTVSLVIIAAAVIVKIVLGRYVKSVGEKVNSGSLIASGTDATMDAIISASTLVAAFIYLKTDIKLEAYLGAIISLVILKAGLDMLRETLSQIIGERIDADLSKEIKHIIKEFPDVHGTYDLILHNYGPDTLMGSVHIEIPDTYTAPEIDGLTRAIQQKVYEDTGVILTAVSVYSMNTKDDFAIETRNKIDELVLSYPDAIQTHGFYMDEVRKLISFDIVLNFKSDKDRIYNEILKKVEEMNPGYKVAITLDSDISD